jgi:hypothetical protein
VVPVAVPPSPKAQLTDVMVPSGSVDPAASKDAVRSAEVLVNAAVGATLVAVPVVPSV